MNEILFDNVRFLFCRITGIELENFQYSDLIVNSIDYIAKKLSVDSLDSPIAARCEYAAASVAVYDYTSEKLLSDRVMLTENGDAYCGIRNDKVLENAYNFRKAALANLHGLVKDDEFIFAGVGK